MFSEWLNDTTAVVVFTSGAIAYLSVDAASLDITQILFDRYCIGKLSGQAVCGGEKQFSIKPVAFIKKLIVKTILFLQKMGLIYLIKYQI